MNKKIKIKSGIEFQYFMIVLFFIYILYSILSIFISSTLFSMITIYILIFLLIYIALCLLVNQYRFYDDRFEITYFFRVVNRSYTHSYDDIDVVKYFHFMSTRSIPTIQILLRKYKYKTTLPFNSFPVYTFKKRVTILKFLKGKGLKIEIHSDHEKDQDILE